MWGSFFTRKMANSDLSGKRHSGDTLCNNLISALSHASLLQVGCEHMLLTFANVNASFSSGSVNSKMLTEWFKYRAHEIELSSGQVRQESTFPLARTNVVSSYK